ncbi:TPA: hypothetical protein JG809_004845 [Vibrio parahaemolyticus]|uniref:hypothetical protein n=1 Tax=Vibrio parahaemolyticus TaxID=670 RepID=UPI00030E16EC|nr:hypothetical protein [Vibrio parahaemolyticus]EMC0408320.1 hypothetical protein [Vibrio fluvialis]EJA7342773.1 hypothetical protein [Vibrio parahaemolyticus]MDF4682315.1 hypothetical protein [Vibrio parahaemolyticus]MDF4927260.1 hypothetical protein [Vibrio parahaemolyticus]MEA5334824.1 hypothetical protein [Vibrio parahaemolyticus]
MSATIYDIIDTAVKIGLGALISGVATYSVTRLNHDKDIEKAKQTRKRELLEDISSQTEEFSNSVLKYWAYMVEHVRYIERDKQAPEDLEPRIENAAKDLFEKFSHLSSAEGKLILLGANKAQELVRDYGEYVKEFRRKAWQGNQALTEQNLDDYRSEILAKRKALYHELRSAYAK